MIELGKLHRYKIKQELRKLAKGQEAIMAAIDDVKAKLAELKATAAAQTATLDNVTGDIEYLKAQAAAAQAAQAALQAQLDELMAGGIGATVEQVAEALTLANEAATAWGLVAARLSDIDLATPPPDAPPAP